MSYPTVLPSTTIQAGTGLEHEEEETAFKTVHRRTRGGRHLWYQLRVIQQPERARACGSGPKYPPPVVELRVFEGVGWEAARERDITFQYNANFFLYATLEHSRLLAHGRVQTPAANTPPVLTGMPVSGMAYLDRPEEAGYFLFPDLSVRHEGRYRLMFNLYEETKEDGDKDSDVPDPPPNQDSDMSAGAANASFDFRMEVKSRDFTVFSAKKFPGLAESTDLSRVVADQGCRVRIRRDVRMRRRDTKGGDFETSNAAAAVAAAATKAAAEDHRRGRRTQTHDVSNRDPHRDRSGNESVRGVESALYPSGSDRRPLMADYPPAPPPQFAPRTPSSTGHLNFRTSSLQSPYPAHAHANYGQPPFVPASPSYPPSHASSYSLPPPPLPPPHYAHNRPPSLSTGLPSPAPVCEPKSIYRRDAFQYEPRRPSTECPYLPPMRSSLESPHPGPSRHPDIVGQTRLPPITTLANPDPPSFAAYAHRNSTLRLLPVSRPDATVLNPPLPPPTVAGAKRGRSDFNPESGEDSRRVNGARDAPNYTLDHGLLAHHRANGTISYGGPPYYH